MRCYQCNQDDIKIEDGKICCKVCGLSIDCSGNLDDELCNLFLYNKEVEEAECLGREAYRENGHKDDNPYSVSAKEIIFNHSWKEGFESEEIIYERAAFFSSAENLNRELQNNN